MNNKAIAQISEQVIKETEKIIVGKRDLIRLMLMAVLAEGHILLEDLPGVGKTTLVKTLSMVLGCDFKRIQFTPDLLPSDIIGMNIYNQKTGEFQLMKGPVMTNILLADEINRAIPRTQSALLESMEEKQVTIDGRTFKLEQPFTVMATQNPIETESTFPLPAAQMDRFLLKISLGYPDPNEEKQMLKNLGDEIPFEKVEVVLGKEKLAELQQSIRDVHVDEKILNYIVLLIDATRNHPLLKTGASPRASRALYKAGKAWAAMEGRDYVTPEDIQKTAVPVLSHRLFLTGEARLMGKHSEDILKEIIEELKTPPAREEIFNAD